MGKKKFQIFISSTYLDLQEERQAAVEAILGSRHIPAGMELFKAGNKSQLDTIKKWIDESDIYMLILGGRYGSIEPETGKSYTHIEYEYAIEKGIPVFAVVLSNSFLHKKASENSYDVFEKENMQQYDEFKELVMSKMIKEVCDCKDIQIAIKDSITELEEEYPLSGWIRAAEVEDNTKIVIENNNLLKENSKLKEKLSRLEENDKIGKYNYTDLKKMLEEKELVIKKSDFDIEEDIVTNYLKCLILFKDDFILGIENAYGMSLMDKFKYFEMAPLLISFGLLELNKVAGAKYRRCQMTKAGLDFIARIEIERNLKNNKEKEL